jgi:Protein of unknown function (DUF2958)
MELITKEVEAILPPLYSQENAADPVAVIKFFDPCGRYTFFVLEGRREPDGDLLLFGFCVSPLGPDCDELGYVTLRQLESVRGPLGLGIERDIYFKPTPGSLFRPLERDNAPGHSLVGPVGHNSPRGED